MATYFSTPEDVNSASGIETICITDPEQLIVSSRTETARGTLVFTLARRPEHAANVWLHRLVITLPTGINPGDLTATPIAINSLAGESRGTEFDIVADLQNRDRAVFTITPKNGTPILLQAAPNRNVISVTLAMIEINTEPGRVIIDYDPWTSTNGLGQGTPQNEVIVIDKTDRTFFLRNLRADPMKVSPGESATVRWEASIHNTLLFLQRDTEPEVQVFGSSEVITNLRADTAITLRAQTTLAGEPVSFFQSTIILVNAPMTFDRKRINVGELFMPESGSFIHLTFLNGSISLVYRSILGDRELARFNSGSHYHPVGPLPHQGGIPELPPSGCVLVSQNASAISIELWTYGPITGQSNDALPEIA